jgi:DNA-binding transcriptional MerR regulator
VKEQPYFRSGELARLCGVSADTLRHYERLKLLPVPRRSPGNYRLYPRGAADRVRLIRQALAVGFSLPELAKILKVRDSGGAPCRQARQLLEGKLSDLDQRVADLAEMRDHLRHILADWDQRLASVPEGAPARLLESLVLPAKHANSMNWKAKHS